MWTYDQASGAFLAESGELVAHGYAGHGAGKNNPLLQAAHHVGPLPCGFYTLQPPVDTAKHGPYVLWLTPAFGQEMYGRSAFGIHGDSKEHPGTASEGCIILPRAIREQVWTSGDHALEVVALLPQAA